MLPLTPTSRAFSYLVSSGLISPLLSCRLRRPFSFSSSSRYPLYYELVRHRPSRPHPRPPPPAAAASPDPLSDEPDPMDRSKRKYYRKREKRMYGGSASDSDAPADSDYVELQPEIVDFPRLHAREQELYFHDAFAFPWEKDKHYRMVYQLEKKYFPDQCLDKAFVDPVAPSVGKKQKARRRKEGGEERDGKAKAGGEEEGGEERDEKAMVFFDEEKDKTDAAVDRGVSEKKVEEFFKCLKKVPNAAGRGGALAVEDDGEPYLVTRRTELPPRWDGPLGTVVLVDKPKGWTSFTVCGKLRRLVKVQKVGHAGTLDPMATGLLVVCVGKATKVVDRYQGMTKGYSGVFRLGEATSTWDADSPVILREPWEHIRDDDIKRTVTSFLGEIWQVPPMFSAIKTELDIPGELLERDIHSIPLCRLWKSSWQLCSFDCPTKRLHRGIFSR